MLDTVSPLSTLQGWIGVTFPVAIEIATLALVWYAAAALSRKKSWLLPVVGFAVGALLFPNNSFWALLVVTPLAALLAVGVSRLEDKAWALPLYSVALLGAVMTGYTGVAQQQAGAVTWALLGFAALAYAIGVIEDLRPSLWLVPLFAAWSVFDAALLLGDFYRSLIVALICVVLGVAIHYLKAQLASLPRGLRWLQRTQSLKYALPYYATALAIAIIVGLWPSFATPQPVATFTGYALLAITILALIVMLVEHTPELLVFPALFAAWAIWRWQPGLTLASLMAAYSLLCVLIFVSQFVWKLVAPTPLWLPAPRMARVLALGGETLVVLAIILRGGLSIDAGLLAHVGAGSLLALALLLLWYGRLQSQLVVRRWCDYASGLLVTLFVSWELLAFRQTNLDLLALAPATYLIVIAPVLGRDETLPLSMRHWAGQLASLLGAALLLAPTLWLSFGSQSDNLLYTLILMGEALALLLLGIGTRMRAFVLSGAGLVIIGALHALFLPVLGIPPSLALTLLGAMLLTIATGLSLARHRIQVAWSHWE